MVIFHSYVSLPEGKSSNSMGHFIIHVPPGALFRALFRQEQALLEAAGFTERHLEGKFGMAT
jgi:hypothetical protein